MATRSLPYMPFYVDDYEGHTAHLTILEDGAYNRLLRLCWRSSECSVPNDPKWIRRKMRASQGEFDNTIKPLIEEFFTIKKGRVFQKRQKEIFLQINSTLSERKKAGKKGGDTKALNKKKKVSSNTTDLLLAKPYQKPSNQSQSQSQSQKDLLEEDFNEFWELCLRKEAKAQALTNYKKVRKTTDKQTIHSAMEIYSDNCKKENTEKKYIKKPSNWLSAEMYLDQLDLNDEQINHTDKGWQVVVKKYQETARWHDEWGPEPDMSGNRVPEHILRENGFNTTETGK